MNVITYYLKLKYYIFVIGILLMRGLNHFYFFVVNTKEHFCKILIAKYYLTPLVV